MKIYVATNNGTAAKTKYAFSSMESLRTRLRDFKGSEFSVAVHQITDTTRDSICKLIEEGIQAFPSDGHETFRVNDAGQLRRVP